MTTRPRTSRRAVLVSLALAAGLLAVPATYAADIAAPASVASAGAVQLVRVSTPTRADKDRLLALGLDLTEHAGEDFVEAVLHGSREAGLLRRAGFSWTVEVADMAARERQRIAADAAYAASTRVSALPSGRTSYRTLAEYDAELQDLAKKHPSLVRHFTLPEKSVEGRLVHAIEISANVKRSDGKPTFVLMGLHHAREWPSGEHAIEFGYDLIKRFGKDDRVTDLLGRARVVIVPVVNPDGFEQSRRDGSFVDLRSVDDGGTVSILGTPGNAYKRKNCRVVDGRDTPAPSCAVLGLGQGGFGAGVDLNRNYGGLWGGPGASVVPAHATYRGGGPFSEPETRNVQHLLSTRHATVMITNHTFSNLVLRPPGIQAQGMPVDEPAMAALGARMAAQNGYTNQPSWALYDTSGTTEDWSYYATGGYGFTFEIGDEFHPPYADVVAHYVGKDKFAGKGNRAAYFIALATAADPRHHGVLAGDAPAGAVLRLKKTFPTLTSPVEGATGTGPRQAFFDTLETTMRPDADGDVLWHVYPSTRPAVMERRLKVLAGKPFRSQSYDGTAIAPTKHVDHPFQIRTSEDAARVLEVRLTWPTPDDLDLEVYRKEGKTLKKVGSSGGFLGSKELALVEPATPGQYLLRVINYASVAPTYTLTASLYAYGPDRVSSATTVEQWELTCERPDGTVLQRLKVVIDRGDAQKVNLSACRKRF